MHEFIEHYLDSYISNTEADYAVMLTGEWGSGKTYFVKEYFTERSGSKDGKKNYVYVSLSGLKTCSEIDREIMRNIYPILGNKALCFIGKVGEMALKAKGFAAEGDGAALFDSIASLQKIKGGILVLDDLERCRMRPSEVFGYVSRFLDQHVHVLLIGAESEVVKLHGQVEGELSYTKIKEKVIGKTFMIPVEIEKVYDSLISGAEFKNVRDLLLAIKQDIIEDFNAVPGHCNYRSLKHAFRDFNFWAKEFDKRIVEKSDFLRPFARLFITLAYEHQVGNLTEEIFGVCKNAFKEDDSMTPYDEILKRHNISHNTWLDTRPYLIIPEGLFRIMLFSGRVSFAAVNATILATEYFQDPRRKTEWQKLMHWDTMQDEDVKETILKLQQKIANQEYVIPEEILHVFCLLCHLARYSLVSKCEKTLIREAKAYIRTLVNDRLLQPMQNSERGLELMHGWGGYGYLGDFEDAEYFTAIRAALLDACRAMSDREVEEWIAERCPGGLDCDGWEFCNRIYRGVWAQRPVFQYVSPAKFVKAFQALNNADKREAGGVLNSRYARCFDEVKQVEKPFWQEVARRLKKIAVPKKLTENNASRHQLCILYNLINSTWELGMDKAIMWRVNVR